MGGRNRGSRGLHDHFGKGWLADSVGRRPLLLPPGGEGGVFQIMQLAESHDGEAAAFESIQESFTLLLSNEEASPAIHGNDCRRWIDKGRRCHRSSSTTFTTIISIGARRSAYTASRENSANPALARKSAPIFAKPIALRFFTPCATTSSSYAVMPACFRKAR